VSVTGKNVTRAVEPLELGDLLEDPPRVAVAFVDRGAVDVLPVRVRCSPDARGFAVAAAMPPDLDGQEVVLVIDDGPYWFELRGISVRGVARRVDAADATDHLAWYAIEPRRVLAWDYGAIREEQPGDVAD
jgi:hypothetical protein